MGEWLKRTLEGILIATLLYGCSRGPASTPVPKGEEIQKVEMTATPIESITQTPEPTATPIPKDIAWIELYGFDSDFFDGYDELQIQTFMDMTPNQVSSLEDLVEVKEDIFDYKLPSGYMLALGEHISPFNQTQQKKIVDYTINMIDSPAYIFLLSDNLSTYFGAIVWDQLEEDFGLNVVKIFDNSEKGTPQYEDFKAEYTDEIFRLFTLGSTVEDRVKAIENLDPIVARNYGLHMVLQSIIDEEKGNTGPVTLYYIHHTHYLESVLIYNDIDSDNYSAKEMFPSYFLENFEGRHLNIILSTCPVGFAEELIEHLDNKGASYILLYGDNKGNPYQGSLAQGKVKAVEVIINTRFNSPPGQRYPIITYEDFVDVSEGDLEEAIVERVDDLLYYTIRPFENYDAVSGETLDHFKLWPAEIKVYLKVESGTHELSHYNYDFEVAIASSENYEDVKEVLPLFGIGPVE